MNETRPERASEPSLHLQQHCQRHEGAKIAMDAHCINLAVFVDLELYAF